MTTAQMGFLIFQTAERALMPRETRRWRSTQSCREEFRPVNSRIVQDCRLRAPPRARAEREREGQATREMAKQAFDAPFIRDDDEEIPF